jgi:hypothetical protein
MANSPPVVTTPLAAASHLDYSTNALDADANDVYKKVIAHEQDEKATKHAYGRQLAAYQTWWEQYQAHAMAADPAHTYIPALLIMVSKAVVFLDYESKRPKKVCSYFFLLIHSQMLMLSFFTYSVNALMIPWFNRPSAYHKSTKL